MESLSDNALMLKVKSGDLDKMGLLYQRYHQQLYGFFFKMCGKSSISEDMVQNVFFRMLKYRHTYKGEGSFKTWIYHLSRNVFADQYRKNKRFNFSEDMAKYETTIEKEQNQEELLIEYQDRILLRRAIGQLSEEKRELLILSKYQGLKYEEIADILNCSAGALKVRLHRIIKELQTSFNKMEKEGNYGIG